MGNRKISAVRTLAIVAGVTAPYSASAGGFYISEQSAKEAGRAYSGAAVAADAPSVIFFNPAAMTELEGTEVEIAAQVLLAQARQRNQGSSRTIPGTTTSVPVTGIEDVNPFPQPLVVPSGYITSQVNDRLWLGLGLSSPYGLVADYEEGFFGRFDSQRSKVFTLNVQPSAAYKVTDNFSIGAGVDLQYIRATLTNAVPNLSPLDPDGFLRVEGDDISIGWNAGMFYKTGEIKLGVHYRSQIDHTLDGSFELTGLTGLLAGGNADTDVRSPLTLPDSATLSAQFGVTTPLRGFATVRYFNWADFDEILLQPTGLEEEVSPQNFEDTWSFAVGAEYDVTDRLTVRTGTQFDQSPITDEFRSTRIPDGDRIWASAGASYKMNDRFEASLSYAHVFIQSEPINRTSSFFEGTPAALETTVISEGSGNADIIAMSLITKF